MGSHKRIMWLQYNECDFKDSKYNCKDDECRCKDNECDCKNDE